MCSVRTSERAAEIYGLSIIARNAENQKDNFTRFMVVSREPVSYDLRIPCKSSLILATKNEEGALLACLNVLAENPQLRLEMGLSGRRIAEDRFDSGRNAEKVLEVLKSL